MAFRTTTGLLTTDWMGLLGVEVQQHPKGYSSPTHDYRKNTIAAVERYVDSSTLCNKSVEVEERTEKSTGMGLVIGMSGSFLDLSVFLPFFA